MPGPTGDETRQEAIERKTRERLEKFERGLKAIDDLGEGQPVTEAATQADFRKFAEQRLAEKLRKLAPIKIGEEE